MALLDWYIVLGLLVLLIVFAFFTKKYTKSVADFLAANRCAGRYLLAVAENSAMVGAAAIVAAFEEFYYGGFGAVWWKMMILPMGMILGLTGWIVYRFRQTRAMTLAQFLEMRYSKRFRIFSGILIFLSGILNFGIFPAIGSRFFIYFCGLGPEISLGFIDIPTFPFLMFVLLAISLFFTFIGGQVSVLATDFIQGAFCNIVFVIIAVYLLTKFSWSDITLALELAPQGQSLINPYKSGDISSFNSVFYLMMLFNMVYNCMAWQGTQGYNCSAINPHEVRMGKILGNLRSITQMVLWVLIPVCAYTVMHHPGMTDMALQVNDRLSDLNNPQLQKQLLVPAAMSTFLPKGLFGAMCAVMLAAFISNHDTYLHSWGCIFIQDVIMPFRKKPFERRRHISLLRYSIIGVAVFIFIWSLVFPQTDFILMYFQLTGAIWLGGAGSVIIGGLYWNRGTTQAAYSSLITGSGLAVVGIIIRQIKPEFFLDGYRISFFVMIISIIVYVAVSLMTFRKKFDLDKMLHKGKYADGQEILEDARHKEANKKAKFKSILVKLGMTRDFSKSDRMVFYGGLIWIFLWFGIFVFGNIYNYFCPISDELWILLWHIWIIALVILSTFLTLWLVVGGCFDFVKMFRLLSKKNTDVTDDGTVFHDIQEK